MSDSTREDSYIFQNYCEDIIVYLFVELHMG